jgi:hypothetical protein
MLIVTLRASIMLLAAIVMVGAAPPADFDAARLQTGVFRYRTMIEDNDAGDSRIEIQLLEAGRYVFSNVVTGAFTQSWEAVTTRRFVPVSVRLVFGAGPEARPAFELDYRNGRVTGFALSRTSPPTKRAIDDSIPADIVDQRIDWAAVMAAATVTPGSEFGFHVYDPSTQASPVSVQIKGVETTQVPAGSYETLRVVYRIDKAGKSETYQVLATTKTPRFMVKEFFPNGAVTELVKPPS